MLGDFVGSEHKMFYETSARKKWGYWTGSRVQRGPQSVHKNRRCERSGESGFWKVTTRSINKWDMWYELKNMHSQSAGELACCGIEGKTPWVSEYEALEKECNRIRNKEKYAHGSQSWK